MYFLFPSSYIFYTASSSSPYFMLRVWHMRKGSLFSPLLPLPNMCLLGSCSLPLSFQLRDLAPSVFFPSVYPQHLPLSLGPPDSGWPGTAPVYSFCPSIIMNGIHFHSQKCLDWQINHLVLLFLSDFDLQPCKSSDSLILKLFNR